MRNRLFSPIAGRLLVIELIAEIRKIITEHLQAEFNWALESCNLPGNLQAAVEDVSKWYLNASSLFERLSCAYPFGGDGAYIKHLKYLCVAASDMEYFLDKLNTEYAKLKDCVSDRNQYERQKEKVDHAKAGLAFYIAITYATMFKSLCGYRDGNFLKDDYTNYERALIADLRSSLKTGPYHISPLACDYFTYEDTSGKKEKIKLTASGDVLDIDNLFGSKFLADIVNNKKFDLKAIISALTHDIHLEFAACEKQLADAEQVIHGKVEPVRFENARLTSELANKERAITAVESKLKITEEERDSAQQMAASFADRHMLESKAENEALLAQLTKENPPLRSRRMN